VVRGGGGGQELLNDIKNARGKCDVRVEAARGPPTCPARNDGKEDGEEEDRGGDVVRRDEA
jgi:hypothetical protein